MKKPIKTLLCMMLSVLSVLNIFPHLPVFGASSDYFEATDTENNAYLFFDSNATGSYLSYVDGVKLGISDVTDPRYSKAVTIDGLSARELGMYNSMFIDVASNFYSAGETEFLISVVYYNDGSGDVTLEYASTSGSIIKVSLKSDSRNVGWNVATAGINDADFGRKPFSENCAIRLSSSGTKISYRKIEIANISRLKSGKKTTSMTCLGTDKTKFLEKLNIIEEKDARFIGSDLSAACSYYDMLYFYNICAGTPDLSIKESYKKIFVNQKTLIQTFLQLFGITSSRNYIQSAEDIGLISTEDFFLFADSSANYYNLLCLVYNSLNYDTDREDDIDELPVFKNLLECGFLNGMGQTAIEDLGSTAMLNVYLYGEKVCPPTAITGSDGRVYYYVNYYGEPLSRSYLTIQQWATDGSSFFCTTYDKKIRKYRIYLYNLENYKIKYLDTRESVNGYMGDDDYLYYAPKENGRLSLWRCNTKGEPRPEKLHDFPEGLSASMMHLTNDCRYASFQTTSDMLERPEGTTPIFRYDIKNGTYDYTYYANNYSNFSNHMQINPVYPDLIFVAHETDTENFYYTDILDRASIMNIKTNEVIPIHQGFLETQNVSKNNNGECNNKGHCILFFSHETWSYNGEYLYITNLGGSGEFASPNGMVRVNKDGSHRQFYYNQLIESEKEGGLGLGSNHAYSSGDNRYVAIDSRYVYIMSTETNQVFPIYYVDTDEHPHVTIARHKYIVNWSMKRDNILGVGWYDFTGIDEDSLATGGKFDAGEYVKNVRYKETRQNYPALSCDTTATLKDNRDCLYAENGKKIYLDINESIVDAPNETVKITFDYFDDSTDPIILTYTKGIENYNDACRFENMQKEIFRSGSQTWKTAEVLIESGNFENPGTFSTDFNISGNNSDVYISNITIENISSGNAPSYLEFNLVSADEKEYSFTGSLQRKNNTVNKATILAATYTDKGKLISTTKQNVSFDTDIREDFSLSLPVSKDDGQIKFYIWDDINTLRPSGKVFNAIDIGLSAKEMANGVSLVWNAVDGASDYIIYKDGVYLAKTKSTSYDDKYYGTLEQLENDYMKEFTTPHNYTVVCDGYISKSVKACADTSLIHYISFENLDTVSATFEDPAKTKHTTDRVVSVSALNGHSSGITMNEALNPCDIGRMNSYYYYTADKSATYKTAYFGALDDNSFFADKKGLNLISASTIGYDSLYSFLKANSSMGLTAQTAISKSSSEGYNAVAPSPFAVVESFKDNKAEEYVVIMTANINTTSPVRLFSVCSTVPETTGNKTTDSSWNDIAKSIPYANGTDENIDVFFAYTGRPTGLKIKPSQNNHFNVPENLTNIFYTYVFNINAYFGDTLVNTGVDNVWKDGSQYYSNLRFLSRNNYEKTAVIRNIGFVKPQNFIK